jgi:hypothetical protein
MVVSPSRSAAAIVASIDQDEFQLLSPDLDRRPNVPASGTDSGQDPEQA